MQRIFIGLALVATLLLVANVVLGRSGGDYNAAAHAYYQQGELLKELQTSDADAATIAAAAARHDELRAQAKLLQPLMTRHMLLGILGALMTLLACSVSITYFVGTSRWFKEVVDTYRLDQAYVDQSQRTKRQSFRWSIIGALAIIVVVGLGAASEPTWANARHSPDYVTAHYLAALFTLGVLIVSFYMQGASLAANGKLIEGVMDDVRRIRQQRGLAVEPEPSHT